MQDNLLVVMKYMFLVSLFVCLGGQQINQTATPYKERVSYFTGFLPHVHQHFYCFGFYSVTYFVKESKHHSCSKVQNQTL